MRRFLTQNSVPKRLATRAKTGKRFPTMDILAQLDQEEAARVLGEKKIPEFRPGDTVIVNVKVKEGDRTRVQAYEGVCIARSGGGFQESFTVRKISYGEGVERVSARIAERVEPRNQG